MDAGTRYLVVLQVPIDIDRGELAKILLGTKEILVSASSDRKCVPAFNSSEVELSGFLIISKLLPAQIIARLDSPRKGGSPLGNRVKVLILEIGDGLAERGFGRLNGWHGQR